MAPIDGVVVEDMVERDSYVQKGSTLLKLEDTSATEVACKLRADQMRWVWEQSGATDGPTTSTNYELPKEIAARITYELGNVLYEWRGVLDRYDGVGLDPRTRTVPCRIVVADPSDVRISHAEASEGSPAGGPRVLVRGMFVTVNLVVPVTAELYRLPSEAIRLGDKIWKYDDGSLQMQAVDIAHVMSDHILVRPSANLSKRDRVIISPLATALDGMEVSLARNSTECTKAKTTQTSETAAAEPDSKREFETMKGVVRWAVNNSPTVNTVMIGIILVGAFSLYTMRSEVFPEFDLEIILVTVPYPGASPAEVEQGICQRIEEAVRSLDGIKKQTSVAQEGSGFLVLELETGVDVQKTVNDVRSEIGGIPSFPALAEDAEVKQITLREPAIRVGILAPEAAPGGLEADLHLRDVTERVRRELLELSSVSQANILGELSYQIDIEIPENRLREYGLTLRDVGSRVRAENLELPGGTMKTSTQEVLLRGKNKRLTGEEIAKIPIVTDPSGVVLTIDDLGDISDAFQDVTSFTMIDGRPGLIVSVDRTKREDLLEMVEEVKKYAETASVPRGYELITFADRSVDVRDRMYLLSKNGIQGLLLVFLVLAIFLELRLSFWVAMGIPVAILGSGIILLAMGQTLNMLSMFAFLMALGIVVDDAIVIGENIYSHRQRGVPTHQAAIDGTLEVFPSVAASVSTTIIAFTPLLFVSGVMGKFIAVMPVAVIAMLFISLVESAVILPCHLAHESKGGRWAERARTFVANWPALFRYTIGRVVSALALFVDGICLVFFSVGLGAESLARILEPTDVMGGRTVLSAGLVASNSQSAARDFDGDLVSFHVMGFGNWRHHSIHRVSEIRL